LLSASSKKIGKAGDPLNMPNTMRDFVLPHIGTMPVSTISKADVLKVLEQPVDGQQFWRSRHVTAARVRARIERVLDYAAKHDLRSADNPAKLAVLPLAKIGKGDHHLPALSYRRLPAFMAQLREQSSIAGRCLEFAILCASRTGEVLGAVWTEIDLDAATWTIPAERMKGGKKHMVPLSARAATILRELPRETNNPHLFIGSTRTGGLAAKALRGLLRAMQRTDFVPHGCRSTFMDWAHEQTAYPKVVIDLALAHKIPDKVEAAYRRGDLIEKRARLMQDWSNYCASPVTEVQVLPLRKGNNLTTQL
jgi:integrase